MDKKKRIAIISTLVVGVVTLIVGLVFLIINLTSTPPVQDGDYLVSANHWVLDGGTNCEANDQAAEEETTKQETNCAPSVIWDFTEIGKGSLTTNNHENDYDFIWALEDGKLKIETKWLYDLQNEYDYKLDQKSGILTLNDGENEYIFTANFE